MVYTFTPLSVFISDCNLTAFLDRLPRANGAGHTSGDRKPCLKGTRTAVLKEIYDWEMDDTGTTIYWLKGVAGCGKTAVAQEVAEHSAAKGRLGGSFFCSRDFEDRRNLRLIIPTLASQLAHHHPTTFRPALARAIRSSPDIRHDKLDVQFENLIIGPLKSIETPMTIVIDALDECNDKDPVSQFLSALARHVNQIRNVKFFITGRPEDHIRSGFEIPSLRTKILPLHDIESDVVDSDIELYVKARLAEIAMRKRHSIAGPWPSGKDVIAITKKSSGFFIIASVIIDFIDDPYETPQDQLKLILSMSDSGIYAGKSVIDVRYSQILASSFRDAPEDDSRPFEQFRLVVASIILAFNPLSRASLAKILGMTSQRISTILYRLHAVLIVPDSDVEPIRICHKSFADFLIDHQRCSDARLHITAPSHHLDFCISCLKLMDRTLKRNICELPRYAMNDDIEDLPMRRETYIGAPLMYACEFWANHLRLSNTTCDDSCTETVKFVNRFFKKSVLSWLEVFSIGGNLQVAIYSLHNARGWLTGVSVQILITIVLTLTLSLQQQSSPSTLLKLVDDVERFVLMFFEIITESAMHIYHSALPWTPMLSLTRRRYERQMMREVKLVNGVDTDWNACIRAFPFGGSTTGNAVFSTKGFAVASPGGKFFETASGVATFQMEESVWSVAFSPDDDMLVCGCGNGMITVWDLQTSYLIRSFEGHRRRIRSVAFSPLGEMIVSGGSDHTVRIWDISSDCCKCVLEGHSDEVLAVCWSGKWNRVISGSLDGSVRVWDVSTQECLMILRGHTGAVTSVASSCNSSLIASGSWDRIVQVYDARSGDILQTISANGSVDSVQFSTNGDKLLYTSWGSATIFDLSKKDKVSTINHGGYRSTFSRDGTRVVSTDGNFLKIWTTENGYSNSETVGHHYSKDIKNIAFAPDGRLMTSRCYNYAKAWDTTSGDCLLTFYPDALQPIVFSPNSAFFAYLSNGDSHIQVWDVHTRCQVKVARLDSVDMDNIALSPCGGRLVSLSYSHITLWDLGSGKRLAYLPVESLKESPFVPQITFAVDGTSVFICDDKITHRWYISLAPLSNRRDSNTATFASLPLVFIPTQDELSHQAPSMPRNWCRYEHNNSGWILDEDRKRLLWLPQDRRHSSWGASKCHGKKIAMGTDGGRVYVADFSDALQ
jgi:WD40 repeat protein